MDQIHLLQVKIITSCKVWNFEIKNIILYIHNNTYVHYQEKCQYPNWKIKRPPWPCGALVKDKNKLFNSIFCITNYKKHRLKCIQKVPFTNKLRCFNLTGASFQLHADSFSENYNKHQITLHQCAKKAPKKQPKRAPKNT